MNKLPYTSIDINDLIDKSKRHFVGDYITVVRQLSKLSERTKLKSLPLRYKTTGEQLKSDMLEVIELHPLVNLILNLSYEDILEITGSKYSRIQLTAAAILAKYKEFEEFQEEDKTAAFQNMVSEITTLQYALRLFSNIDIGELHPNDMGGKHLRPYNKQRTDKATNARNTHLDSVKEKAALEFMRLNKDNTKPNFTKDARDIFWNYLSPNDRSRFRKFVTVKREFDFKPTTPPKGSLKEHCDNIKPIFAPYKTLAEHFSDMLNS